jgi:iron-sulfur cluster repair protein YtfE (RIC family)
MKRHSSLAILSREHHGALILAQSLKKDAPVYKGLPADLKGKTDYALRFYENELLKHFNEEEEVVIKKIKGINIDLDMLADEITTEHKALRILFASIKNSNDLVMHLDKLGCALEQHIRKEERKFFPLIQEYCSEKLLSEIERALSV